MTTPSRQKQRLIAYLIFTGVLIFGLWYSSHRNDVKLHRYDVKLHVAAVSGCRRSNTLRNAMGQVLMIAEQTVRAGPQAPGDERAARKFHSLAEQLLRAAQSLPSQKTQPTLEHPVVDCDAAYPPP